MNNAHLNITSEDHYRLARPAFVWLATIVILLLIFWKVPFSGVASAVRGVDARLIALGALLSCFAHVYLAPAKYRSILKLFGCAIGLSETVMLRMGTLPVKSVLPFKMGELGIIAYLGRLHGLHYSKGISSVIWGYILSGAVCVPVLAAGLILNYSRYPGGKLLAVLLLAVLSALALLAAGPFKAAVSGMLEKMKSFSGFGPAAGARGFGAVILYTAGFEGIRILNTFLVFRAMGVHVPLGVFLIFVPLTLLVSSLPITVGGLGTREASVLFFFSGLATPGSLLGCSLLISFVNRIFPMLLGVFFLKPFLNALFSGRPEEATVK